MALFDALTGAAGHQAASNQRDLMGTVFPLLTGANDYGHDQARDYFNTGFGGARTDLGTGYNTATGAINNGVNGALGYLDQGTQDALGYLGQARNDLTANGGAFAPLSALASQYGRGADLYANALGINGASGNAAAQAAFQEAPGTAYQRDQGIDAINRRANAAGMLVGGNADRDAISFASNLANQGYSNWLNNLSGYNNLQLAATQGAATGNAGINNSLANLDTGTASMMNNAGQNKAQIAGNQGSALANLAQQYYGNLGTLDTSQGGALGGNELDRSRGYAGAINSLLPGYLNSFTADANASNAGSANSLGLGMNLLKLGVGAAGGMGGSSFLPSSSFMNNNWGW